MARTPSPSVAVGEYLITTYKTLTYRRSAVLWQRRFRHSGATAFQRRLRCKQVYDGPKHTARAVKPQNTRSALSQVHPCFSVRNACFRRISALLPHPLSNEGPINSHICRLFLYLSTINSIRAIKLGHILQIQGGSFSRTYSPACNSSPHYSTQTRMTPVSVVTFGHGLFGKCVCFCAATEARNPDQAAQIHVPQPTAYLRMNWKINAFAACPVEGSVVHVHRAP